MNLTCRAKCLTVKEKEQKQKCFKVCKQETLLNLHCRYEPLGEVIVVVHTLLL